MALRVLYEAGADITKLSASVCIVGAGMAGLIAATRLARDKQRRIVIVESGHKTYNPASNALNKIDSPANGYETGRHRGLGGTSLIWSGKLLPLNPHDTLPRSYLDAPGWPFDIAELDPYRREIEALLGVDTESHEEDITDRLDPRSLLPEKDADISLRWPKRPSTKNHNLAYVFRKEIERLDNIEIWLDATASGFEFDPASGKITALTAVNHAGKTLKVAADEYLLAAGTLESTRLLLLADRQSNHAISRDCAVLGRYFNDHLCLHAGTLQPLDRTLINQTVGDRSTLSSKRLLYFELSPEAQEQTKTASAFGCIGLKLPDFSSLTKAKQIFRGLKRGRLDFNPADIKAIFHDLPSLFWTAQWRWMRKQKYWPANAMLQIELWAEQIPQWRNRVYLSDRKDALQLPMLKLDWGKTDLDEKTFRTLAQKMDRYWKGHLTQAGRLEWNPEILNADSRLVDSAQAMAHPAGSSRMGTNPAESVVAPDLRVHCISNLSIASASVFPTSGSANPTLTIMQLAMRAADAIARRTAH